MQGGQAELFGDAGVMYMGKGGSDTIQAGRYGDSISGDAFFFAPHVTVQGGADQITGGAGPDQIAGDAFTIYGQNANTIFGISVGPSYGGDDSIDGASGNGQIWGDAQEMD